MRYEANVEAVAALIEQHPRPDFRQSGYDWTEALTDVMRALMVRSGQCSEDEAAMLGVQVNGIAALRRSQRMARA